MKEKGCYPLWMVQMESKHRRQPPKAVLVHTRKGLDFNGVDGNGCTHRGGPNFRLDFPVNLEWRGKFFDLTLRMQLFDLDSRVVLGLHIPRRPAEDCATLPRRYTRIDSGRDGTIV
eukprot:TRINITY_DN1416_c0_g1_i1.p1 TRINITY_DN1416_c0_g1~~TRINITY_DN1416_c0_g1_i1.p1  ORF type:complete len:116 (-),score=5.24 TRINITY_DN1416_c0_g1_i1:355-702(-)